MTKISRDSGDTGNLLPGRQIAMWIYRVASLVASKIERATTWSQRTVAITKNLGESAVRAGAARFGSCGAVQTYPTICRTESVIDLDTYHLAAPFQTGPNSDSPQHFH
jgi:hypothetical protein